jgi:hypothetical protein
LQVQEGEYMGWYTCLEDMLSALVVCEG